MTNTPPLNPTPYWTGPNQDRCHGMETFKDGSRKQCLEPVAHHDVISHAPYCAEHGTGLNLYWIKKIHEILTYIDASTTEILAAAAVLHLIWHPEHINQEFWIPVPFKDEIDVNVDLRIYKRDEWLRGEQA